MRTRLTVRHGQGHTDVVVGTDAAATVGDVAGALVRAGTIAGQVGTPTLQAVAPDGIPGPVLRPATLLTDAGLRSGATVAVADAGARFVAPHAGGAVLRVHVVTGPTAGAVFDLPAGVSDVGRGPECEVRLNDRQVSKKHARLVVTDQVLIADSGSLNGVVVDGGRVDRAEVRPGQEVKVGDSTLRIEWLVDATTIVAGGAAIAFNRSPRVVPRYAERSVQAPEPPAPASPGRFPWVAMAAPIAMGAALYAVTRSVLSLVFIALSPLLAAGTWVDKKIRDRQQLKDGTAQFRTALDALREEMTAAHEEEQRVRREEEPDTDAAVQAAFAADPVLWSRRREADTFATLHLGHGTDASRTTVAMPSRGRALPDLWAELERTVDALRDVASVPLLVNLRAAGAFGLAGLQRDDTARALVAQLVALHSPADLTVAAFASKRTAGTWEWLKWLPHVAGPHTPLGAPHLAASPAPARALLSALEELAAARSPRSGAQTSRYPMVVVLVEDDCPADRGRLVRLAEVGPAAGVHLVWVADRVRDLPAACTVFLDLADPAAPRLGSTTDRAWRPANPPGIDAGTAVAFARHLSAFNDAGAPTLDESDVPRHVTYLQVAGTDLATDSSAVIDRWTQTASILDRDAPPARRTADASLRAVVGVGADGDFALDLREQGPHALVGGTTGSGKSEFLQSWVLGMASAHSPDRVTFLFVDYKGGAAFADCVHLPHCVGLVTDLTPHLVRRALTSLRAELRRRERLLAAKGAKDLLSLERTGDPDTPPALVIVVDEFAALVSEVPEFVDGMIDIAQRGRSLGLHLILATQRPAGVIKDNLRANTNLRVALRVADAHDSTDVLGTDLAAKFDPALPGRGAVRTGPERVAIFQTAYAGGHTPAMPPPPPVDLSTLEFGPGVPIDVPSDNRTSGRGDGSSDISRVVATIRAAVATAGIPAPTRPWLPELRDLYDIAHLQPSGSDSVVYGVVDVPSEQKQSAAAWNPDQHGSIVVHGTTGSGKSATLRTIAAATPGPVHVYGIDASSGGLDMLEPLPQVGAIIDSDDTERVSRLTSRLGALLDERATAFSTVHAASLTDFRAKTGRSEPRVLVLIDGLGALRDAYETDLAHQSVWAALARVVTEGRPLGVHLVASAERAAAVPTTWGASIGYRVVLRQADENAYVAYDIPRDVLASTSPPGRGVLAGTDTELQVAVPGGSADPADQAAALHRQATAEPDAKAPTIHRLPALIAGEAIPSDVDAFPVLGVAGDTLEPLGFDPSGAIVVAGSPGSGRSTTLVWLAHAIRRARPHAHLVYIGNRRSPAASAPDWAERALTPEDAADLARELTVAVADEPGQTPVALVVEALADFIGTPAEAPLLALMKAARRGGHLVVAEGDTPAWASGWPLIAEVRNARRGLVLAPEPTDGEALFRVQFPRTARAAYPPGRGVWVEGGRARVVQIPMPPPSPAPPHPKTLALNMGI
ncbi:FtsK/SpoIIIE domain-containing protein [Cellulomonas cellasea]|uniref:FtsK/SpoIIIE domain-containing protein n=1 Tax=Cellulomonas cellasea TaxID=43670 RepID=UPI0025A4847F|nr:FtsK/SpoIIIE domain-containing protein [Cellulomonas cellasea]MDM8085136.1 FtsK/SpoIIIE domain-containing protein [Cellulomonas cellasea]